MCLPNDAQIKCFKNFYVNIITNVQNVWNRTFMCNYEEAITVVKCIVVKMNEKLNVGSIRALIRNKIVL